MLYFIEPACLGLLLVPLLIEFFCLSVKKEKMIDITSVLVVLRSLLEHDLLSKREFYSIRSDFGHDDLKRVSSYYLEIENGFFKYLLVICRYQMDCSLNSAMKLRMSGLGLHLSVCIYLIYGCDKSYHILKRLYQFFYTDH